MKICLEICILINYMLLQCFVIALKKDIQRVKLVHFQLCCEVHLDGLPSDSHLQFKVKICLAILHSRHVTKLLLLFTLLTLPLL